jgi:hypothetical protein
VRPGPGGFQAASTPAGQRPDLLIDRAQLAPVVDRLLQVEADDLVVLAGPLPAHLLEPRGEALVQLATILLGERLIGGIADQVVAELEGVLAGDLRGVREHQAAAHQRGKFASQADAL